MPPGETKDQRKIRLQNIRRYWAVRWYKYKSIPTWKWTMQFAFSPPYQYTSAMCSQYTEENRHQYYPVPPKLPHPNTLKTPDDYPDEQERLRVAAEAKRLKEEKKAAKLAEAEAQGEGPSKTKKKLKKKNASPPHATTEDEEHARLEQAAMEDSIMDESNAADDESEVEADDESEDSAPPKKQKLKIPLKKKPGEKPNARVKPSARPNIDLSNLVVS